MMANMDDSWDAPRDEFGSRKAPLLYVVDGAATILFASAPVVEATSADVLRRMLHAAVESAQAGDTSLPLTFEGQRVRSERLATSDGGERYAISLERTASAPTAFSGTLSDEVDVSEDRG